MPRTWTIVVFALLFTAAFFAEYLPIFGRVFIPFDLDAFHYPLADYAFQAIRAGRFPLWDPTIYCGLSFAGNPQAALFYPPTWLMFVLNLARSKLSYQALEYLVLAHVWLAFALCYLWLHGTRKLHWLASVLGAGVFAFSGYMLLQLQHMGQLCGYAWMPLGFLSIDEMSEHPARQWRALAKLALAFAMCILAGYPPQCVVFAVCMVAYACNTKQRLKILGMVVTALTVSVCLAAVQLLPAWEASRVKVIDVKYGAATGVRNFQFYLSYFVPNYFNFGMNVDPIKDPQGEYLYLGATGLVGLALLARRRFRGAGPPVAVLLASLAFLTNPFGIVGAAIGHSQWLSQIFTDWYFVAGISAAAALLAALGLDAGLNETRQPLPLWCAVPVMILALAWSVRLLAIWARGGSAFFVGWQSSLEMLGAAALIATLVTIFGGSKGRMRTMAACSLLLLSAAEYKSFGTSRRFNAAQGRRPPSAPTPARAIPGVNSQNYAVLRDHAAFRVALDNTGLFPALLRHAGLSTPQGFDPLLPAPYYALIDPIWPFRSNREFDITPEKESELRLMGVGYFISSESAPLYERLAANSHFRLLQPANPYYKVFEFLGAEPAFGWEQAGPNRTAQLIGWEPERRTIKVRSEDGGEFRLAEQYFQGWTATIDGAGTLVERCHQALQCLSVPAGEHIVEFRYRSRFLLPGATISLLTGLAIAFLWRKKRPAAESTRP